MRGHNIMFLNLSRNNLKVNGYNIILSTTFIEVDNFRAPDKKE